MANYRINSFKDSDPCPSGNRHVDAANIQNSPGTGQEVPMGTLLDMQDNHDNFVLVVGGLAEVDWPSATFDLCPCGSRGHYLKTGPSAVDLTAQAIQDAEQ